MLQYIRNMPQTVKYKRKQSKNSTKNNSKRGPSEDSSDAISSYRSEKSCDVEDDVVSTLSKNWGGADEIGLRTAIFVSFMKLETFKNGIKVAAK